MKIIPIAYNSVSEMLHATMDAEFANAFDARQAARKLVTTLVLLRASHGISESEHAAKIGWSDARYLKFEYSRDANLKLGDIVAFVKALGKGVKLVIGQEGDGLTFEVEGKPEATDRKRVQKKD